MNTTRNLLTLGILFLSVISTFAQDIKLQNHDNSEFPKIKLRIQNRNPEAWIKEDLLLQENGKAITSFDLKALPVPKAPKQQIFILFQNSFWFAYEAQRNYFKNILKQSLDKGFSAGDELYFTEFDWTDENGFVINPSKVIKGTTNEIMNVVSKLSRPPVQSRLHEFSEVNTALMQAIDYLNGIGGDSTTAKSILILSDEVSNIYNSQHSHVDIIYASRQKNIPIYALRFPKMADKYSFGRVANESYGRHLNASLKNPQETVTALIQMMQSMPQRAMGHLYDLQFDSETAYGNIAIKIDLTHQQTKQSLSFTINSPSTMEWFFSSSLRVGALIGGVLLIIGIVAFLLMRSRKKAKEEREEQAQKIQQQLEEQQTANERKIKEQEEKFMDVQASKEDDARLQQFLKDKTVFEQASLNRFKALPRRPYLADFSGNTFPIQQPIIFIGRGEEAQIMVDHQTVSRKHAAILFERLEPEGIPQDSNLFFLKDLNSSNGTSVNNKKVRDAVALKDGDVLKFGNITLSFRC